MVNDTKQSILALTSTQAHEILLKSSSYCKIELPRYFDFTEILAGASAIVNSGEKYRIDQPRMGGRDGVNHTILDNKDGTYGWRPLQLIHPIIYAELVARLTAPENWQYLQTRFAEFQANEKILCVSLPIVSIDEAPAAASIRHWWKEFERASIRLSLDYKYLATTDISDCYGSLYTHSVAWAIHGRSWAKLNRKEGLGNEIDSLLQDMNQRQTNGIPQGSMVSDLIAETVLGYADLKLTEHLRDLGDLDYKILRYRDDYRVFTNSSEDARLILLALSSVLGSLNFKLNGPKTKLSDDVISSSIGTDKLHWNKSLTSRKSPLKTLFRVRELGQQFPNSGSLVTALNRLRRRIDLLTDKPPDNGELIAVLADIMYHNPKTYPFAPSILSMLLSFECPADAMCYIARVRTKFSDIPNIGMLEIWMQRIELGYGLNSNYEEQLCQVVAKSSPAQVWNSEWLAECVRSDLFTDVNILDRDFLSGMGPVITLEETELFELDYDYR